MDYRNSTAANYAHLMKQAEQATNRKEALDKINQATQLLNEMKWCGGRNGWDNWVERWHVN